nr:MAG TPA: protein of unknown function (DUF4373) [Caudoviricetes sp.]
MASFPHSRDDNKIAILQSKGGLRLLVVLFCLLKLLYFLV